jgi:hypothetical protein
MTINQAATVLVKGRGRADLLLCAHRDLTLEGRYLRWKGFDLKRSLERYTCNGCGKPVVRSRKTSVSH